MRTQARAAHDFGRRAVFGPGPAAPVPERGAGVPLRLLFVCTANISRSPYAELRARQLLLPADACEAADGPLWVVSSAGVPGLSDRLMDPQMRRRALERGVPADSCDAHRSRPVDAALVEDCDLILTMEKRHRNAVLDTYPTALGRILMLGQAAHAARRLSGDARCAQVGAGGLVPRLVRAAPRASGRLDVPDPYRREEEVSRRVASLIDDYLVTIASLVREACTPLATVATERGGAV